MAQKDIIIKDTHRGLWYQDGVLNRVLEAGRYELPRRSFVQRLLPENLRRRLPKIEIAIVDVRERDLTIKGQEILTADKVAIRVSIIVQFRVLDPRAALHEVESYSDRIYSDVQLAARRSLASMTLDEILTNRNQLSEDILRDVKESAGLYGVSILRADVKDLIFPGNLQEIMNRVLAAERESQAAAHRLRAESEAESQRIQTDADILALRERATAAQEYSTHPALMRLRELDTLRELARVANARIYIRFDKHVQATTNGSSDED